MKTNQQQEVDLFEHYDKLPKEVQTIIDRFPIDGAEYDDCEKMREELKPLGYTFEYYLDAVPYNLRKI